MQFIALIEPIRHALNDVQIGWKGFALSQNDFAIARGFRLYAQRRGQYFEQVAAGGVGYRHLIGMGADQLAHFIADVQRQIPPVIGVPTAD